MGAISNDNANLSDLEADRISYFGRSSTVDFFNQVRQVFTESESTAIVNDKVDHVFEKHQPLRQYLEDYAIPARCEADLILAVFWARIFPLYPFLDREEFERAYNKLWNSAPHTLMVYSSISIDGSDSRQGPVSPNRRKSIDTGVQIPESRHFHILLNVIFALGCSWDSSDDSATQRGEVYWNRCKELLERSFDIFNCPKLLFIQALLYIGLYLQSTMEMTGACWNMIGAAVRMSQSLGLHNGLRVSWERRPDSKRHALRWKTWIGCIIMDR